MYGDWIVALLVIRDSGVSDLQKFFHAFATPRHDVSTNSGNVLPSLLLVIEWWIWNEAAFEAVARPATENKVLQVAPVAALRAGDKMILGGHHKPVVVRLEVKTAIDTSSLVALEQLEKL
jgi:hypothetical protein